MGGICGWTGLSDIGATPQAPHAGNVLAAMARELTRFDDTVAETAVTADAAIAACGHESVKACYHAADGRTGALVGQAWFAGAAADLETLHRAWAGEGPDMLRRLSGHFALVLLDGKGGGLFAVDRVGSRPLILAPREQGVVFGSSSSAINCHGAIKPALRTQAIMDFLFFHMVPGPGRAWEGQILLQPGQFAELEQGQLRFDHYHQQEYREDVRESFTPLREEFRTLLRDSVARAVDGRTTGCFLSGGTDSSTVAGMLGKVTGAPANTFSIGFEADGFDEMEYARITARHFDTRHTEYYVTPSDIVDMVPRIAAIYDAPFANSSAVPAYFCAQLARETGMDLILGGDGGDELFAGNKRYATQRVFAVYDALPGPLRAALGASVRNFPLARGFWPIRKARSYVEQAAVPMPQRLETYNILHREGLDALCTPAFLAAVDAGSPDEQRRVVYDNAHADTMLNRMLDLDLKFTLADNDLPKVSRMCELARIGVNYPMLDDGLLDFAARLHPDYKLKGTQLRWFFKEALRGFLPDETLSKSKQGFGLPFGLWAKNHKPLNELTGDSLETLKRRGVINPEFIDTLWNTRMADHPTYYGSTVWLLMTLEQWLQQHAPDWSV
ncbi:MAG: asparagine synthetase B family protein [Gammaproteobacteria bacterium]